MPETQLIENVAPHSVELTTNARGFVQVGVKVYAADPHEAADTALAVLRRLREQLGTEMAHG